ncbi:MAG: exodeoxyribonuclease V subunit alpha [Myxococcota bacterium]
MTVDQARLDASLDRLFGASPDPDQRRAASGGGRGLAIISGGPGTGKTSTVVRILAALFEQQAGLTAALVAPTGKAATRLGGSIREQRESLDVAVGIRDRLPEDASTIHRRLEVRPDRRTRFRHDGQNPLPADVVVLDEASMVDLALMTKLVEAVRPEARLILIGDKDQLASVAAGHVLGDIADAATPGGPLADSFVLLGTSHRFVPAIGELARAIQRGDESEVVALLGAKTPGLDWIQPSRQAAQDDAVLRTLALGGWSGLARSVHGSEPAAAMKLLERFQILCAHRRGRWGSELLTQTITGWLAEAGEIPPHREWYAGRPVIVTVNDAALGLYNGDVGLALTDPDNALRVHFPRPGALGGGTRALAPSQLPTFDAFYATTVHKAQGSGFDDVVVVLPAEPSAVLTRELLYTAVTRARKSVTIVATEAVLRHTVRQRVERASGLRAALRGEARR